MKPAADTSVRESEKSIQPTKTGAFILGKLGKLKSTAIAAVAALGLATSAEAQSAITITAGLPSYGTIPGGGTAFESSTQPGASSIGTSRLEDATYNSTFLEVTIPAVDAGIYGGMFVINNGHHTTRATIGTPGQNDGDSVVSYSLNGGISIPISTINTTAFDNIGSTTMENPINVDQLINVSIPVAAGDNVIRFIQSADSQNITGQFRVSGSSTSVTPISWSYVPNPVPQDINLNGMADSWEATRLHTMESPANGDPDHDGVSNLLEYAFNTDPLAPNGSTMTPSFVTVDGENYLCITYPKNPIATNLTYTAETSSDLVHWTASDTVNMQISTTSAQVRDRVPVSNASKRFIRVGVRINP